MSYQKLIIETTGCTAPEAAQIEDIMRHDIFHSTLDWVPKKEFDAAAHAGYIHIRRVAATKIAKQRIHDIMKKHGRA